MSRGLLLLMHIIRRIWKPLLAVVAVAAAFTVTFVWPKQNGLDIDIDGSARARAARNRDPYDLTQLQVLNRAILEVKEHYVDPERVRPKRMLLAGLNAIQRSVPPVLVDYREDEAKLNVQVKEQKRTFAVSDVNSPWRLAKRFREVFGFLQSNLGDEDVELRDVEYAAVNGMLRTLDPHSVLLTPDIFEEMQMSTRGEFGGLGIVISIRDGHLTIIRPMPNTPASRSKLKRGDRIVKINDESTLNMPLSEAVDRLRGPPGSKVRIWISRKGSGSAYSAPRRVQLERAVIHIDSVESRMLADRVGYIKINNFQGNTSDDMHRALTELHGKGMKSLVLDLRDNPGGLLDQAVRVTDTFLTRGTIVTTSSNDPSQRDEKFATAENTEPDYPMVVLINGASASASEIVAGALKNHDRALVVGEQSFGKGSVQVLYNFQDSSALKLTIAQYLTPGDVSIQGVGIVPDIAIDPMTVDRDDMDLAVDKHHVRESDLSSHLTHERARSMEKPNTVLRYYLPKETRLRLQEAGPNEEENEQESEFLTRFSQSLLAQAEEGGRQALLSQAQPAIAEVREAEMAKAVKELRRLGVDWRKGEDEGSSQVRVELSTDRPNNEAKAGEAFSLKVKVTNTGEHPLYRLRATTKSDNRLYDGRELVFGRLEPGQTREWSTTLGICTTKDDKRTCRVPRHTPDRADGIRVEFREAYGHTPESAEIRTSVKSLPRPQFAYGLQVADNVQGNGDGKLQRGERATMYLRVKNIGEGRTYTTQADLRNLSGRGVLLQNGRFRVDNIAPNEERVVPFTFEVLKDFDRDAIKLEVSIADTELEESVIEKLELPVSSAGRAPTARTGKVTIKKDAKIFEAPARNGSVVARARRAMTVEAQAKLGGYIRVDLGEGRPGWVKASDTGGSAADARASLSYAFDHMPPQLEIDFGDKLVTRKSKLRVRGSATDDQRVHDLYVFAGARKVFYRSNRSGGNPRRARFDTTVPLHGGTNYITVFARERDDVVARRVFVVRRDGPGGKLLKTPRLDAELFGMNVEDLR